MVLKAKKTSKLKKAQKPCVKANSLSKRVNKFLKTYLKKPTKNFVKTCKRLNFKQRLSVLGFVFLVIMLVLSTRTAITPPRVDLMSNLTGSLQLAGRTLETFSDAQLSAFQANDRLCSSKTETNHLMLAGQTMSINDLLEQNLKQVPAGTAYIFLIVEAELSEDEFARKFVANSSSYFKGSRFFETEVNDGTLGGLVTGDYLLLPGQVLLTFSSNPIESCQPSASDVNLTKIQHAGFTMSYFSGSNLIATQNLDGLGLDDLQIKKVWRTDLLTSREILISDNLSLTPGFYWIFAEYTQSLDQLQSLALEDSDLDGINDTIDLCDLTAQAADVDLFGCSLEQAGEDADSDGRRELIDNCPLIANADQVNTDNDDLGDVCDPDDDDDGIFDTNAAGDTVDNCSLIANADQLDTDNDGLGDACDPDDDNDGVLDEDLDAAAGDVADNCPLVANALQLDIDIDGIGDACDDDIDGDTVSNILDAPGDVAGDVADNCPLIANLDQADGDADGIGDACDDDTDGDDHANAVDNCPLIPNEDQADDDADEIGNLCDTDLDNDGVANLNPDNDAPLDVCPNTPPNAVVDDNGCSADQVDTDADGEPNVDDPDDDNDGIADIRDLCPLDLGQSPHINNDGCLDTDDDGVADLNPAGDAPLDICSDTPADAEGVDDNGCAESQLDTDVDGDFNDLDEDDDNDGVDDLDDEGDSLDNCPLNPNSNQADIDNDGLGDVCDPVTAVYHMDISVNNNSVEIPGLIIPLLSCDAANFEDPLATLDFSVYYDGVDEDASLDIELLSFKITDAMAPLLEIKDDLDIFLLDIKGEFTVDPSGVHYLQFENIETINNISNSSANPTVGSLPLIFSLNEGAQDGTKIFPGDHMFMELDSLQVAGEKDVQLPAELTPLNLFSLVGVEYNDANACVATDLSDLLRIGATIPMSCVDNEFILSSYNIGNLGRRDLNLLWFSNMSFDYEQGSRTIVIAENTTFTIDGVAAESRFTINSLEINLIGHVIPALGTLDVKHVVNMETFDQRDLLQGVIGDEGVRIDSDFLFAPEQPFQINDNGTCSNDFTLEVLQGLNEENCTAIGGALEEGGCVLD